MNFAKFLRTPFYTEHLWWLSLPLLFRLNNMDFKERNFEEKLAALYTAQKMKFSIKDFFSKCVNVTKSAADLVTFTEEILNRKLHFLCSVNLF